MTGWITRRWMKWRIECADSWSCCSQPGSVRWENEIGTIVTIVTIVTHCPLKLYLELDSRNKKLTICHSLIHSFIHSIIHFTVDSFGLLIERNPIEIIVHCDYSSLMEMIWNANYLWKAVIRNIEPPKTQPRMHYQIGVSLPFGWLSTGSIRSPHRMLSMQHNAVCVPH